MSRGSRRTLSMCSWTVNRGLSGYKRQENIRCCVFHRKIGVHELRYSLKQFVPELNTPVLTSSDVSVQGRDQVRAVKPSSATEPRGCDYRQRQSEDAPSDETGPCDSERRQRDASTPRKRQREVVPVWAKGLNTMLSASAGHPPRSFFHFKILKLHTGNDARAHYLQYLAMPALVRKRGHRCPRPLFTALRDARAARHGCPR